jgi:hypothetical protein
VLLSRRRGLGVKMERPQGEARGRSITSAPPMSRARRSARLNASTSTSPSSAARSACAAYRRHMHIKNTMLIDENYDCSPVIRRRCGTEHRGEIV